MEAGTEASSHKKLASSAGNLESFSPLLKSTYLFLYHNLQV
jgi:hypothetical protein